MPKRQRESAILSCAGRARGLPRKKLNTKKGAIHSKLFAV